VTTSKAEQETILRFSQDERVLHLYTSYGPEARKWTRLGYAVEVVGRTPTGAPRSWRSRAPIEALRLRKLINGHVVKRRRGLGFALPQRKLAGPEHPSHSDRDRETRAS
jgi:hypothetical protein